MKGEYNYNGTMFGKVKKLELGDVINLTDLEGTIKQYTIYDKYITNPNDISITETKEFGSRELTLITCTNDSKMRVIVKARVV
jgi:LPXTG-site transpeptidase (sortase) family protein